MVPPSFVAGDVSCLPPPAKPPDLNLGRAPPTPPVPPKPPPVTLLLLFELYSPFLFIHSLHPPLAIATVLLLHHPHVMNSRFSSLLSLDVVGGVEFSLTSSYQFLYPQMLVAAVCRIVFHIGLDYFDLALLEKYSLDLPQFEDKIHFLHCEDVTTLPQYEDPTNLPQFEVAFTTRKQTNSHYRNSHKIVTKQVFCNYFVTNTCGRNSLVAIFF